MDANIDSLTSLPNRRQFAKALMEATRAVVRPASGEKRQGDGRAIGGAVILLGIDNFGYVNEAHGHDIGDRILAAYGDALTAHLGARDLLSRERGDEFAVLARDIVTETGAVELAEDLNCVVASTGVQVPGHTERLTSSAGVALFPIHSNDSVAIMSLAQSALRAAKTRGKNRVVLADPDSNVFVDAIDIERYRSLIQDALAQDRLLIHLQPILEIGTGAIARYEALVRILDPAGDLIPPDEWIPKAEDLHLIEEVDKRVVSLSLAHWSQMARGGGDAGISINVSRQSINREMAEIIVEMIAANGVNPNKVTIEVTETALAGDTTDLECFLCIVRNAGARVAVDDYGSGNASLRRIRGISFDSVKLDGSLIQEIATSESDRMFARALTELFHSMGLDVVAEYVEDENTLQFLAEIGVDYAQGYFVGRPVPASEMPQLASPV